MTQIGRPRQTKFPKFNSVTRFDFDEERLKALHNGLTLGDLTPVQRLGKKYLHQVILAIEIETETLATSTAKNYFHSIRTFFKFICTHESEEAKIIRMYMANCSAQSIKVTTASAMEDEYRTYLCQKRKHGSRTLVAEIHSTNAVLRILAIRHLWPHTLRLKTEKENVARAKPRRTILESLGHNIEKMPHGIFFPQWTSRSYEALQGLKKLSIDIPKSSNFLISTILAAEEACLKSIRTSSSEILKREFQAWAYMKGIVVEEFNSSGEAIKEWAHAAISFKTEGCRNYQLERNTTTLFPCSEQGLGRILAAIEIIYFSGEQSLYWFIPPKKRNEFASYILNAVKRVLPVVAKLRPHTNADLNSLRALLVPSPICSAAVLTLLMAETGMNLSPALLLPWHQVKPTNDPNWISIATWKDRARGSLIVEELEVSKSGEEISAGRALMMLKDMSTYHFSLVETSETEKIQIFSIAGGFIGEAVKPFLKTQSNSTLRNYFNSIVSIAFGAGVTIPPSSMRPSLLTVIRGQSKTLGPAQVAAGHKNRQTTSRSYAGNSRTVFNLEHLEDIRIFQSRLETISLINFAQSGGKNAPKISTDTFKDAIRSGLGTLCLQKQLPDDDFKNCTNIQDCPRCKSITISTSANDLADLLSFQKHLETNRNWLETHRSEAWLTRWIFWMLLAEEVVRIGKRSRWSGNLQRAQQIVADRPQLELPPLW